VTIVISKAIIIKVEKIRDRGSLPARKIC